jgi:hypothetical protein
MRDADDEGRRKGISKVTQGDYAAQVPMPMSGNEGWGGGWWDIALAAGGGIISIRNRNVRG